MKRAPCISDFTIGLYKMRSTGYISRTIAIIKFSCNISLDKLLVSTIDGKQ